MFKCHYFETIEKKKFSTQIFSNIEEDNYKVHSKNIQPTNCRLINHLRKEEQMQ